MIEALKPCPFCGHTGLSFSEGSTFRWLAYSCAGCGIGSETRVQTMGDGTKESWLEAAKADAISEWNKRAAIDAALAQADAPADPMNWPLPCDVKVGNGTHRKGTPLRTLVARMTMLHRAAFGDPPTPEQAAHNLAVLQGKADAPADERKAFEAALNEIARHTGSDDQCRHLVQIARDALRRGNK